MNDMTTNQATYPTLFDLFQTWANDGYPDYVTGIWSNDGSSYNLTVGVVEGAAGEAGKQEILNLIENDASVTFTTQAYSHNYLMQVQEELNPYFKQEELGMVGSGIYDSENHVEIDFLTQKANDETTPNRRNQANHFPNTVHRRKDFLFSTVGSRADSDSALDFRGLFRS